ncbi:uncharacterized protein KY384_007553 [Bacidia gigantensis]|uniref:uncharacterized protein n=1 Tax=Bacidia gigantensis TaxID=2732470 RepID=UPI001D057F41|nr:uncharacterized protein KY384_007553 [Bacidia gigantensis]KAG8527401.1 hypothetical protein KY384_007553 [Bacidia gigantensis]
MAAKSTLTAQIQPAAPATVRCPILRQYFPASEMVWHSFMCPAKTSEEQFRAVFGPSGLGTKDRFFVTGINHILVHNVIAHALDKGRIVIVPQWLDPRKDFSECHFKVVLMRTETGPWEIGKSGRHWQDLNCSKFTLPWEDAPDERFLAFSFIAALVNSFNFNWWADADDGLAIDRLPKYFPWYTWVGLNLTSGTAKVVAQLMDFEPSRSHGHNRYIWETFLQSLPQTLRQYTDQAAMPQPSSTQVDGQTGQDISQMNTLQPPPAQMEQEMGMDMGQEAMQQPSFVPMDQQIGQNQICPQPYGVALPLQMDFEAPVQGPPMANGYEWGYNTQEMPDAGPSNTQNGLAVDDGDLAEPQMGGDLPVDPAMMDQSVEACPDTNGLSMDEPYYADGSPTSSLDVEPSLEEEVLTDITPAAATGTGADKGKGRADLPGWRWQTGDEFYIRVQEYLLDEISVEELESFFG